MKIIVDTNKCIGCGACVAACPEAMELHFDEASGLEKARVKEGADLPAADCLDMAIQGCPVQAISKSEE